MSSSSRAMNRVLRGEAGRRATTETFGVHMPETNGRPSAPTADPFAAARAAGFQEGFAAGLADAAAGDEAAVSARSGAPVRRPHRRRCRRRGHIAPTP